MMGKIKYRTEKEKKTEFTMTELVVFVFSVTIFMMITNSVKIWSVSEMTDLKRPLSILTKLTERDRTWPSDILHFEIE